MIKFSLLFLSLSFIFSQSRSNLNEIKPDIEYDNVHVITLDSDSDVSNFIIFVKKSVKAHFHESHTETIYVIEGEAIMKLGDEELIISKGSYVFIPKKIIHSVKVTSKIPLKVLSIQAPKFDGKDRIFVD